jgi:hypothetical protein
MMEFKASSPAKATGTARVSKPVKPIREVRAETAFALACYVFAAVAELVQVTFPRRGDRADRVATASANAVIFYAAAQLSAVCAEMLTGKYSYAAWSRMQFTVARLESSALGFVYINMDHYGSRDDVMQCYDTAWAAIDAFERYCLGRAPQV